MTEILYRRKPLVWEMGNAGAIRVWRATAMGENFSIYVRNKDCIAALGLMEWCEHAPNLDEAKRRVEAEIDRRLASVLKVCDA